MDVRYGLTVATPPVLEPVTLVRAKAHLRVDHSDDDANITAAISAARALCETHAGRYFLTQTVRLKLADWPHDDILRLTMFGPNDITAVSAFTYRDVDGASQTLSSSVYQTEFSTSPPEIALAPSQSWPDIEDERRYPITLDLTVGAASAAVLDARIAQAILLTLGYWDANRAGEDLNGMGERTGLPPGAKRLLDSIWSGAYG